MRNECPACGAVYSVTPQHVGRRIACKKCGAGLVVEPNGIALAGGAARAPDLPPTPVEDILVQPIASATASARPSPVSATLIDDDKPPRRRFRAGSVLLDYLRFRRMLTPMLIQVVFWVGVAYFVITGVGTVLIALMNLENSSTTVLLALLAGVAQIILGPIFLRVACEIVMVVFRIHETLREVKEGMRDEG